MKNIIDGSFSFITRFIGQTKPMIDTLLLDQEDSQSVDEEDDDVPKNELMKAKFSNLLTKILAMDCEMVGVGPDGKDSIVARVSIINFYGDCVYDKYVKPTKKVTDYRTEISGIRPGDIKHGEDFRAVRREVCEILRDRILVGHSIMVDLKALCLYHPKRSRRDTAVFKPLTEAFGGRETPSLKTLALKFLKVTIQDGEHSSVQDAQAAMALYIMFRNVWEKHLIEEALKPENDDENSDCPRFAVCTLQH